MKPEIEVGDFCMTPSGNVIWQVKEIASRTDPLGVLLESGLTDRLRYEDYSNLVLYSKQEDAERETSWSRA